MQERSRRGRSKLWKTASPDYRSDSLFHPHAKLGICACGPCNRRETSASKNQGSEAASEDVSFSFNLAVDLAGGVCTFVTLCCAHRLISREIIVSAIIWASNCEVVRYQNHGQLRPCMPCSGRRQASRFGCAGALRSRGFGCLRSDERHATSVEFFAQISECRELVRTAARFHSQLLRRRRSVRHWASYKFLRCVFSIQVSAEFESQLKIVAKVPGEFIRFSPHWRLHHTLSLVRTAAWDGKCSVVSVVSTRAVSSKNDVPPRQPLDLVGVLASRYMCGETQKAHAPRWS